jgi:hypothetical protein
MKRGNGLQYCHEEWKGQESKRFNADYPPDGWADIPAFSS